MSTKSPALPLNAVGEKVAPTGAAWLVFDLETVNDPSVPPPEGKWELASDGEGNPLVTAADGFPSPAQCQVVAAGACALDEELLPTNLIIFGRGKSESAIVWDFSRYANEADDLGWVTFNGRGFDVPVLMARLMRHGWRLPVYFGGGEHRYRYAKPGRGMHVDLCDQLSDHGAARRGSLLHYCRSFGLPGKLDSIGAGDSVAAWYAAKQIERINVYCLLDVVQEALLFQRFMLLCGQIERAQYKSIVRESLARFEATPVLAPLFEEGIDRGKLLLEEG